MKISLKAIIGCRVHGSALLPTRELLLRRPLRSIWTSQEIEWQYDNAGSTMQAFTFNGTIPGPVVRVTEGDTIEFTLTNSIRHNKNSHSIDFHAARVNVLGRVRSLSNPEKRRSSSFKATKPGVFYYHCGSSPMQEHIARGMFGVIIVDPINDTRPKADREYVLVQSEIYDDPETLQQAPFKHVTFNGRAFRYDPVHDSKASGNMLMAKPGESA